MNQFLYETQGSETVLVYHLSSEEHLDHFAKGMLQGNDMAGILRPSFIQRDLDQYLKYPVTSKIPLEDFIQGEMERSDVLKLCFSIAEAIQEIEEYMMSQEKLLLDPEYIYVDIAKKTAHLIYLPIDEVEEDVSFTEFILGLLSHMCYRTDKDVSYVVKMINFLNQKKSLEIQEFKLFIQELQNERESAGSPGQGAGDFAPAGHARPVDIGLEPSPMPMPMPAPPLSSSPLPPPPSPMPMGGQPPYYGEEAPGPMPVPGEEKPKKKGWFGRQEKDGKEKAGKKEKADKKKKKGRGGAASDIVVPGMSIPGAPAPGAAPGRMQVPGSAPEVILDVDENGRFLPTQPSAEKKKKGGFLGFGKKKKEEAPELALGPGYAGAPQPQVPPYPQPQAQPQPYPYPQPQPQAQPYPQPQAPYPQADARSQPYPRASDVPPMQHRGAGLGYPVSGQQPDFSGAQGGGYAAPNTSSYGGRSAGMGDDGNRTVILGGGSDYGATVILGAEDHASAPSSRVVRITRRRTRQGMNINKDVFHIGREGSFADFYIGDNPMIGAAHADIFRDEDGYYISDRNTVNHTFVNGAMVMPGTPQKLNSGDIITLADEDFEFIIS